jgi:hypothetical protein
MADRNMGRNTENLKIFINALDQVVMESSLSTLSFDHKILIANNIALMTKISEVVHDMCYGSQ